MISEGATEGECQDVQECSMWRLQSFPQSGAMREVSLGNQADEKTSHSLQFLINHI